jgi:hypothetical protein
MKAYRGRRGVALLILNLGAEWRRMVALPPEKNLVTIARGAGAARPHRRYEGNNPFIVRSMWDT